MGDVSRKAAPYIRGRDSIDEFQCTLVLGLKQSGMTRPLL